jgi:hypothetical protein
VIAAGFVSFDVTWRGDVYKDAPQASSAAKFGTLGINFTARRALDETESLAAMAVLTCQT